eukprot:m.228156 g.228156  ORF g.228156 m.228156 type:complete len:988 (+) comp15189_c0_seq1:91-3054(+)
MGQACSKGDNRQVNEESSAVGVPMTPTATATEPKSTATTQATTEQPAPEQPAPPTADEQPTPPNADEQPASTAGTSSGTPMRLLKAQALVGYDWVRPYESIPKGDFVEVSIDDFLATYCHKTAAISWRWAAPKPQSLEEANGIAGQKVVPANLIAYLGTWYPITDGTIEYLWLDWACVPQYQDAETTMREINRSGLYYRESKEVFVWCYDQLDEPHLDYHFSSYFGRAWTLSERLHRSRGQHRLVTGSVLPSWFNEKDPRYLMDPYVNRIAGQDNGEESSGAWLQKQNKVLIIIKQAVQASGDIGASDDQRIREVVISRFARLQSTLDAITGPLSNLLDPVTSAAMENAIAIRAYAEWYHDVLTGTGAHDLMDMQCMTLGFRSTQIRVALLNALVNYSRMKINNLNQSDKASNTYSKMSSLLMDLVGIHDDVQRALADSDTDKGREVYHKMCKAASQLWMLAVTREIVEEVDETWIRRYLTFEIGHRYQAWMPADLLFAIYKLFDVADGKYGDEVRIWRSLAHQAKVEYGSPYSWFRNLARPDKPDMANARVMATNRHDHKVNTCATNFGIFGFEETASSGVDGIPSSLPFSAVVVVGAEEKSALVAQFEGDGMSRQDAQAMVESDANVASMLAGIKLSAQQAYKLSKARLSTINLATGTEIDAHVSLRGRQALADHERLFQSSVQSLLGDNVKATAGNCLFISVKYNIMTNSGRTLLLWANQVDNAWSVEAVCSIGSAAQKGSTWGFANMVNNLVRDALALDGVEGASVALDNNGVDGRGMSETIYPSNDSATGTQEAWWTFPLVTTETPQVENEPEQAAQPASSGHAAMLQAMAMAGLDITDIMAALGGSSAGVTASTAGASSGAAPAGGKVTFTDSDIAYANSCFDACKAGMDGASVQAYQQMLSANYVHDSIMAKNLEYYTKLAEALTTHFTELPSLKTASSTIEQKLDYLVEDLDDAIDMSGADEHVKDAATSALRGLRRVL